MTVHPFKGLVAKDHPILNEPIVRNFDYRDFYHANRSYDWNLFGLVHNVLKDRDIKDEEFIFVSERDMFRRVNLKGHVDKRAVRSMVEYLFEAYSVRISEEASKGMVNAASGKNRDGSFKYTDIKFGKLLKKMFYFITDEEVERIVDSYKSANSPIESEIKFSDKIAEVCQMAMSPNRSAISTSAFCKSLPDSCMRHSFEHLSNHPMEAYESGDFVVAYILDKSGLLLARTIIYKDNKSYAPIYSVSQPAYVSLKNQLNEMGYVSQENDHLSWLGAKLKVIKGEIDYEVWDEYSDEGVRKCIIMPYVDIIPCATNDCDNDYIYITHPSKWETDPDEVEEILMNYKEDPRNYFENYDYDGYDLKNSEGYIEC